MVGVVILTHGLFGEELYLAAQMIIGRQDKVDIISIQDGFSLDDITKKLSDIVTMNGDNGTLIFTDMFGGSPSNIAFGFLDKDICEVVSGVNLPMLIKAFSLRHEKDMTLSELAHNSALVAKDSIRVAGEILNKV